MSEYTFKDVAVELGTSAVTLRKWCQLLEQGGYQFLKTDGNKRQLSESDREVLTKFKQLNTASNIRQEEVVELIMLQLQRNKSANPLPVASPTNREKIHGAVAEFDEVMMGLRHRMYWRGAEVGTKQVDAAWHRLKGEINLVLKES